MMDILQSWIVNLATDAQLLVAGLPILIMLLILIYLLRNSLRYWSEGYRVIRGSKSAWCPDAAQCEFAGRHGW